MFDGKHNIDMGQKKKKAKKRMGRPSKAPSERLSERIGVRVTKAQRKKLEAKARRLGVTISDVIMQALKQEE